jgi:nucleosome binding factor SPN SPT16 subunit
MPWADATTPNLSHVTVQEHVHKGLRDQRHDIILFSACGMLLKRADSPTTDVMQVINLERVGFNLKNFDMAIVFKDFAREVSDTWFDTTLHLQRDCHQELV